MKDYSGNTLQSSGNIGSPAGANNILYANIVGPVQGNVAIGAGNGGKAGYYLMQP
jgi:hypothetical protein